MFCMHKSEKAILWPFRHSRKTLVKRSRNSLYCSECMPVEFLEPCFFQMLRPFPLGLRGGSGVGDMGWQFCRFMALPAAGSPRMAFLQLYRRHLQLPPGPGPQRSF